MALTPERIEEIKKELMALEPEAQQKRLQEVLAEMSPEEREQLVGKQECPFCLMVEGKIPVKTVYDDDSVMAILDINPANKGHVLLFPKDHASFLAQVPDDTVAHLFKVANKIAAGVFDGMEAQGTNIMVANGAVAGQTAPHVIVNIIPRFEKDKVSIAWNPIKVEDSEMEEIAEKIRAKIPSVSSSGTSQAIVKEVSEDDSPKDELRIP